MKTKFDRTTAGMLKKWSEKPPTTEKHDDKKKAPNIATVQNIFEGFAILKFEKPIGFKISEVVEVKSRDQSFGNWKILSVDDQQVSIQKKPISVNSLNPKSANNEEENEDAFRDADNIEKANNTTQGSKDTEDTDVTQPELVSKSQGKAKELQNGAQITFHSSKKEAKKTDLNQEAQSAVSKFERQVILGQWDKIEPFLGQLKKDDADKVFGHLLASLAKAPQDNPKSRPKRGEQPAIPQLSPDDILALSDASPKAIQIKIKQKDDKKSDTTGPGREKSKTTLPNGVALPPEVSVDQLPPAALAQLKARATSQTTPNSSNSTPGENPNHIAALALLINNSKSAGHDFSEFLKKLQTGTRHFGGHDRLKQLTAADLLIKSGFSDEVEQFLPKLNLEETKNDLPALKLWSQLAFKLHAEKQIAQWLEKAWRVNQWIVAIDGVEKVDREFALSNLVKLSSKIDPDIGIAWMNESFSDEPERGMVILTNLGTKSSDMARKAALFDAGTRLDLLTLQNEAVEKLIHVSPTTASQWKNTLTLLAQTWMKEANTSLENAQSGSRRDNMEIDMYGNYYWVNQRNRQSNSGNSRRPRPIEIHEVIRIAPSENWQALIDPSLHHSIQMTRAKLLLRDNEEDKAFPFIEEIAATHAKSGRELVHEFLRIWTRNHDPNSNKRRRNPYIYSYGFDRKADAIPLTRSKQERNLTELSQWVKRIRKLPIEDIDEELLANAFTTCHSSAEVFKLKRFRDVFGDLSKLKPETIAAICEKMRANLANNWRSIKNQEKKQTNRREPEVQKEVVDGYRTGLKLLEESLSGAPKDWKLNMVKARLMYDKNAYDQSIQKSSEYIDKRDTAFEQFHYAAHCYQEIANTLETSDQKTDVFDNWFYAALGACDLGKITDKTVPDKKQYPLIREALNALPGELAESHMAIFANNLFTRMSPIKPEIKFRYLRGGLEIAGEHPRAWQARDLSDYYKDLVSEIKFVVEIDGDDRVGHDQPFGIYVNILHTSEIERESGGFSKYVQNQNSMMYSWNYGRPTENYRDKFSDAVDVALDEHFEILNITYQGADSMKSRPSTQQGWRVTPYAYVLLKAKGPEIDRISPLKLDLDFLDTSGYVVIPIESPALVIDASTNSSTLRPVKDLEVVQTLDERQADDGKLIVEITARGKGLVPELDKIIDLDQENFELVNVDDQGVLPSSFEKDTDDIQILSDRSWSVEYKANDNSKAGFEFIFSEPIIEEVSSKFQRYDDADLIEVAQTVSLEKNYQAKTYGVLYWMIPLISLCLFGVAALIYASNQPQPIVTEKFSMPDDVNPFTVLTLLKDIRTRNGINNEQSIQLDQSINRIEQFYFGESKVNEPDDLTEIAKTWIRQAK
ncbi:MAG: hypothetical protein AAGA30_05740 [Planctomycetota bacterium]